MAAIPKGVLESALNIEDRSHDDALASDITAQTARLQRQQALQPPTPQWSLPSLDALLGGGTQTPAPETPQQAVPPQPVQQPWQEQRTQGWQLPSLDVLLGRDPNARPEPAQVAQQQQAPEAASGMPVAMPTAPQDGQPAQAQAPTARPVATGGNHGEIDNSSREAFIRTAYPYMLEAAGGDQNLAELMLAKAISENGSIGSGRPFWANNFSGIKGEGDAGSVEADTWEDYGNGPVNIRDRFAAYSTPQAGMAAFMQFLRDNSRYHPALARYEQTRDASQLFRDILAAGYATDKAWADKVESIRANQVAPIVRGQSNQDMPRLSLNAAQPPAPGGSAAPPAPGGVSSAPPGAPPAPWEQAEAQGDLMLKENDGEDVGSFPTSARQIGNTGADSNLLPGDGGTPPTPEYDSRQYDEGPREYRPPAPTYADPTVSDPAYSAPRQPDPIMGPEQPAEPPSGPLKPLYDTAGRVIGYVQDAVRSVVAPNDEEIAAEQERQRQRQAERARIAGPRWSNDGGASLEGADLAPFPYGPAVPGDINQTARDRFPGLVTDAPLVPDTIPGQRPVSGAVPPPRAPLVRRQDNAEEAAAEIERNLPDNPLARAVSQAGRAQFFNEPASRQAIDIFNAIQELPFETYATLRRQLISDAEAKALAGTDPLAPFRGLGIDLPSVADLNPEGRPASDVLIGLVLQGALPDPADPLVQAGFHAIGAGARGTAWAVRTAPRLARAAGRESAETLTRWGGAANRGLQGVGREVAGGLMDLNPAMTPRMMDGGPGIGRALAEAGEAVPERPVYSPEPPAGVQRRYHGTAGAFERPDPSRFDENGLYGPGYYTTSDPRVAGSYADNRGQLQNPDTLREMLASSQRYIAELRAKLPQMDPDGRLAKSMQQEIARLEAAIPDWERQLAQAEANPSGPYIRAIDVPNDVRLLDVDAPLDPALLDEVDAVIDTLARQSPDVAERLREATQIIRDRLANGGVARTNDAVVQELFNAAERIPGMGKGLATEVLQRAGFDGIAHKGGQRVPMLDSTGAPIEHDVTVIFPDRLDRVRNAFSGEKGGAFLPGFDPTSAAMGGAAGAMSEGEDGEAGDPLRTLAGMGVAGVAGRMGRGRGVRATVREAADLAEKARLAKTNPGGVQAAMEGFGPPSDILKMFQERYSDPRKAERAALEYQRMLEDGASEEQIANFLRSAQDGRLLDRFNTIRYASMLSDPKTHGQNSIGSLVMGALDMANTPFAALADVIRSRVTGAPRETFMSEMPARLAGWGASAGQGLRDAAFIMRNGLRPQDVTKLDQPNRGFATNIPGLAPAGSRAADTVDAAMELPMRALAAADAFWRGTFTGGHLAAEAIARATRNNAGKPPSAEQIAKAMLDPDVIARADAMAARSVLQESRHAAEGLNKYIQGLPDGVQAVVSTVMPYIRTPFNIVAQGVGMTPLGLISLAQDIRAGKPTREINQRVGRLALGTMAMGWAGWQNMQGNLTGPYPENEAERSTLPPGWRPWSYKVTAPGVGTQYVPIGVFGPVAVPMVASILMTEGAKRGQKFDLDRAAKVAQGIGQFAEDQTFLRSLADLSEAFEKGGDTMMNYVERLSTQASPHIVGGGGVGRRIQEILGMPQRDPEGVIEALAATHPAFAGLVPPKRDVLGRQQQSGPSGALAVQPFVRSSQERDAPVLRAYRQAKVSLPRGAPKDYDPGDGSGRRPLSRRQREAWKVAFGQALQSEWSNAGSPSDPAELRRVTETARERALSTATGR